MLGGHVTPVAVTHTRQVMIWHHAMALRAGVGAARDVR